MAEKRSKKALWLEILSYVLLGVSASNCYNGWKPADELDWAMWVGNLLLGLVAVAYIATHPSVLGRSKQK